MRSAPSVVATTAAGIARALEQLVGPGMAVQVEPVERIEPEPSGKRLVIKSLLAT
jgi:hypothetical protein